MTIFLRENVSVATRYVDYAAENDADSPHYIVERAFAGPRAALLDDFAPPALFADDLLSAVPGIDDIPGSKRARYWFVGGPRTGTFLHVDPFCTFSRSEEGRRSARKGHTVRKRGRWPRCRRSRGFWS